ncbi:MAG TPA: c-type cytochrome domain-containing protein, partial [Gammaproteobacteria bacterium]|nr:c-type cytochrome domain-containing protein [Gammaproteobacteria bacterium]
SNPSAWEFPIGTRLWKEFAMGRPIETRMIERLADGSWRFASYVWNDDGSDAVLAPADGIAGLTVDTAPAGRYAVPSEYDCRACHEGGSTPILGFSALQLSPDRDPLGPHAPPQTAEDVDLHALVERGLLRKLPQALLDQPPRIAAASPEERAALGYLHGNCGHCHSDPGETGAAVPVDVLLAQDVRDPMSAGKVLRSLLDVVSRFRGAGSEDDARVVVPGHAQRSVLVARMRSRDPRTQMPPLGTAIPDSQSLALIERWINQLPPVTKEKQP